MQVNAAIQLLKKVTLSLKVGCEPGKCSPVDSSVPFAFIYGVASDGLSPFESALSDKHAGDTLIVSVKQADAYQFFGHIFHTLSKALGMKIMPETICLEIEVAAVTDPDDREVVQSVASALKHGGCGGSCGCGC